MCKYLLYAKAGNSPSSPSLTSASAGPPGTPVNPHLLRQQLGACSVLQGICLLLWKENWVGSGTVLRQLLSPPSADILAGRAKKVLEPLVLGLKSRPRVDE